MLPNLDLRQPIVDSSGVPSFPFHVWWQKFLDSQNGINADLQEQISLLTGLDSSVTTILAAANNAILGNSGILNGTLTATDAGSNARIVISGHVRVYGDGRQVSVSAGTVSGLAYSTLYYVYYDQESREGGAVQYFATTSKALAVQAGDRHFVGTVTTPAALAADTTGTQPEPPGFSNLP
jgi:hypothetical protein